MINQKQVAKVMLDLQPFLKKYGVWIILASAPLLVNLFFWRVLVVPVHQKLNLSKHTETLVRTKPELESLIGESGQLLSDWGRKGFGEQTSMEVMKEIQKLAGDYRVQIKEVRVDDSQSADEAISGFTKTSINFDVIGSYNKLAQWVNAVESKPGVKINNWSFSRSNEQNQPCRLNVGITVLLKNG